MSQLPVYQQKLSERLSKGFERLVYWNEYKTKNESKNMTSEPGYFLESNFVGINRLYVLVYFNRNDDVKKYRVLRYYLPKGTNENYNLIINGKNFYNQPIDSDIK